MAKPMLDYRRGGRPVRQWGRRQRRLALVLVPLAAVLLVWQAGPGLAAAALALPGRVLAAAAPRFTAQLTALRQENFALRTALARASGLETENAALRALLGSPARPEDGCWQPARVTGRAPGTLTLRCEAPPAVGAAVLDRQGRYAGRVTAVRGSTAAVELPGTPACLAGESYGVLRPAAGGWQLDGLPLPNALPAGTLVTTADGLWVGRLAAAPQPDPGGLTAHAPLTGTAALADAVYFVANG